jgi:hypothetical protein
MVVAEEHDNSPLDPSGNQEETAGSHTDNLPPVEGDRGGHRSLHPDADSPEQRPMQPVIEEEATTAGPIDVAMHDELKGNDGDLLFRIRGLYRLLDLINEQGSGGAGMINVPSCYITETQPTVIPKWTRSLSLKSPWRSCERYLPGCLHFHDKGEYQWPEMAATGLLCSL